MELPEWTEFSDLDEDALKARWAEAKDVRALRESIPDWLDKLGVEQLGEELWTPTLAALNEQAPRCPPCQSPEDDAGRTR